MAERKGPGGERAGHDPVESGQQEDRTRAADERDDAVPVDAAMGEGTDLIDNHRDSDSAESGTTVETDVTEPEAHSDAAGTSAISGSPAEILQFRPREGDAPDDTRQAAAEGIVDLDEIGDDPVDLAELLADDALLDALAGTDPDVGSVAGSDGPDLESLLVAWRQDVDSAPIEELVDAETAAAAIAQGTRPHRRLKRRHLVPVASAAAVLMIAFTGVGLAARDAQPGDALWGVAQVLYTDHARAAQARSTAEGDLEFAEGAWEQGNRSAAEAALKRAREQMAAVDAEHGLDELEAAHASLTAKFGQHEDSHESSTSEQTSSSELVTSTTVPQQPPPPHFPPPPDTTSSQPPSSTTEPSESTTSPSETSGTSDSPSSGSLWGGGGSENPFTSSN